MNTYEINTDPSRLQLDAIHAYLTRSYWSPGIPKEVVARAIANSMCFGIYLGVAEAPGHGDTQVGFARVVTDKASFAYLADVYVLDDVLSALEADGFDQVEIVSDDIWRAVVARLKPPE